MSSSSQGRLRSPVGLSSKVPRPNRRSGDGEGSGLNPPLAQVLREWRRFSPTGSGVTSGACPWGSLGGGWQGIDASAARTSWLTRRQIGIKTLSDPFQELGADFGEEVERRASWDVVEPTGNRGNQGSEKGPAR